MAAEASLRSCTVMVKGWLLASPWKATWQNAGFSCRKTWSQGKSNPQVTWETEGVNRKNLGENTGGRAYDTKMRGHRQGNKLDFKNLSMSHW